MARQHLAWQGKIWQCSGMERLALAWRGLLHARSDVPLDRLSFFCFVRPAPFGPYSLLGLLFSALSALPALPLLR